MMWPGINLHLVALSLLSMPTAGDEIGVMTLEEGYASPACFVPPSCMLIAISHILSVQAKLPAAIFVNIFDNKSIKFTSMERNL